MRLKPGQHLVYEMRLDLAEVERGAIEAALSRLERQSVGLTTLATEKERDPTAVQRAYALHNACRQRLPPAGQRAAALPFRLWCWSFLAETGPDALPEAYFIATLGDAYVGLSAAVRMSVATGTRREPDVLVSGFTGVLPQHGGRGIGAALKAATVLYALENGYREMRATVLAENAAMLHINEALGFRTRRQGLQAFPLAATKAR